MRRVNLAILAAAVLAATPFAARAQPAPAALEGRTVDIQGADPWRGDPHFRKFYDAVVAAFAKGPDKVDAAALEKASFAIFRQFAVSKRMNPDVMQDHLKLIPRQMIQIAREDPEVLTNYEHFLDAGFGPK